jgi:hypothetical protein
MPGEYVDDGGEGKDKCNHGCGPGTTQEVSERAGGAGPPVNVTLQRAREYGGENAVGNPGRMEAGTDQSCKASFFLIVVAAGGTEPCVFLK